MQYQCPSCDMAVKGIKCAKCDAELIPEETTKADGTKVQIAKCPNNHGKIKSPQCCGKDMQQKTT